MNSKLSVTEAKWWMDCRSRCSHSVRAKIEESGEAVPEVV